MGKDHLVARACVPGCMCVCEPVCMCGWVREGKGGARARMCVCVSG